MTETERDERSNIPRVIVICFVTGAVAMAAGLVAEALALRPMWSAMVGIAGFAMFAEPVIRQLRTWE